MCKNCHLYHLGFFINDGITFTTKIDSSEQQILADVIKIKSELIQIKLPIDVFKV